MRYFYLLFLELILLAGSLKPVRAQAPNPAPAWEGATTGSAQLAGRSFIRATATDATGNVFVTGYFAGHVAFGNIKLTNASTVAGVWDLFVAKYVPATGTWAWAQRGGGTGNDYGYGIAVRNGSVYVTGAITNSLANTNGVTFGGIDVATSLAPQSGASSVTSQDIVVAKYTDNGTSATLNWTQVAGGTDTDIGYGIAASGAGVYLTGTIFNASSNSKNVLFGGSGTVAGTLPQHGTSPTASADLLVAKYLDNGTSASVAWTQVGGGLAIDIGQGIAVSGASVYVTGYIGNSLANSSNVVFGGSGATAGTVPQSGATSTGSWDMVVAKYTDNGASATLGWTQVGGGTNADYGYGIAASGNNVYVTGYIYNNTANANQVVFGGAGTTAGTTRQNGATSFATNDIVVVKYLDNGSSATVAWTQVAGGTGGDYGYAIAVSGSEVYVAGSLNADAANSSGVVFGGSGTTAGTIAQSGIADRPAITWMVAKYLDQGSSATVAWTQVAGGSFISNAYALAVSSAGVYVGGLVTSGAPAVFGTAAGSPLLGAAGDQAALGWLSPATGSWQAVTAPANGGTSTTYATATDAAGNVFVTGVFSGQVTFGNTTLSSAGDEDLFVAKYVPTTGTWAWAQRGGGIDRDRGSSIAVRGTSVYVAGAIYNNITNTSKVSFGGTNALNSPVVQCGANGYTTTDLLLAKYTDNGSSATLNWTHAGGGIDDDVASGVAVSGTSVYVTGYITNNLANSNRVVFGSTGTTVGTAVQHGASSAISRDIILAKYIDNGSSATLGWTQVGGGTGTDVAAGVAVNGANVYVTGSFQNSTTNYNNVLFGGSGVTVGTVLQYGANGGGFYPDLILAKYLDQGSSATVAWTQVAGGGLGDSGTAVAVSGQNVYVTGSIVNSSTNYALVTFGGSGTTAGTVPQYGTSPTPDSDIVLAKYLDNGSSATLGWTQVGGGTGPDIGYGIAVNGTSIYLNCYASNTSTNSNNVLFGGTGAVAGSLPLAGLSSSSSNLDIVVAKYLDNGSTASVGWAKAGGGEDSDIGYGIAVSGSRVYVVGFVMPAVTFGSFTATTPPGSYTNILAWLSDVSTPLATVTGARAVSKMALHPNPAAGPVAAQLTGARPGAQVQVLNALGQLLATTTANATGTAVLPGQLPAGLYVVRCGEQSLRFVQE